MVIKIKDTCIVIIYVLIFVSALAYVRFTVTNVYKWRMLYFASIFGIIGASVIYKLNRRRIVLDPLMIILCLIIVYELVVSYFSNLVVIPMIIVDVIPWPLLLSVFYDYSKFHRIPDSFGLITFVGMMFVCTLSIPNIIARFTGNGNAAVFSTYYCISFLPMVFITGKQKAIVFFSVIVGLIMLLSLKRAAFIIVLAGLFFYYVTSIGNQKDSKKKIRRAMLFALVAIVVLFIGRYVILRMNLNILYRLSRIVEDGGSGRDRIWNQIGTLFNSSRTIEKWFGHGFHAVFYKVKPLGIARYAHNSFLETLYDYGYIGLTTIVIVVLRILIVSYFFEQSVIILPLCVVWGICMGTFLGRSNDANEVET